MIKNPVAGVNKPEWSLYDIQGNPEHDYAKSVMMEFCDISGIEISYYKLAKNIDNFDVLYGESENVEFSDPITTKIIYEIDQEPNMYSVFGMFGDDTIVVYIPKGTYYRDIDKTYSPNVGDVIKVKWNSRNFEIVHVDDDERVFQLYKYVWVLTIKPYRLSSESDSAEAITGSMAPSAYSDNAWIEEMSDEIDDYTDIDKSIYGF